jgi:nicotinate-nucleotide adenylyltransferase
LAEAEADAGGVGLFGGTFDPPHVGHLVVAANVRWALGLEEVLVVVANEPWQKAHLPVSPAGDRLAMVEAAVDGVDGVSASALEIERGGRSYTADTLAELDRRRPGRALHVILGSDAAAGLDSWERADEVRERASIVVVTRPGAEGAQLPPGWRAQHVEVPRLDVSSTDLRERVAAGRPLDGLVPGTVVALIRERGLYAAGG